MPPKKKSTAELAVTARDLIEQLNRDVLDDAGTLTAPNIHDTTRVLMSLVDRLPQAFEQLRAAAGDAQALAHRLAAPARTLFSMGHNG
ncbi:MULTISPECIES: hypothetical protein [Streptacidiphilus]|uniref:Uncharacterized protein n=1 Tax=Streptacidiphilus cavernicola TaxID=3342716 RepID=A0ABV6UW16_9ACTN|nr:hypothetical protein [Streptacidiphilus jeojiense]